MREVPPQLRPYIFKKGHTLSKGKRRKSLKSYAKEYLEGLDEDEKIAFLNSVDPDKVWRMAEGNPPDSLDMTTGGQPFQPPIYGGLSRNNRGAKDIRPNQKDTGN